jgi:type IV pilus assembly protein PilC
LVPLLNLWWITWTGARFASVFALFVKSGGGLLRGLDLAGAASGSALIREATRRTVAEVKSGQSLTDAITGHSGLPEEVERAIQVGDSSGRLEEECSRAADQLQSRAMALLDAVAEWLPRLLYVGVLIFVGWGILQMGMQVGGAFGEVLDP